ncbi:hypothetical protein CAMSH0001_0173 [Campylobacter showae RM3277]|uniref:Uncharacterized protein n=1 Tax=Campylobacter showae RM3277 TaxID=553219 RepID=C6RJ72_9BACT|nr:hypothetical protein CAMSH0001_0173 [Campylobacter showae RM3277]
MFFQILSYYPNFIYLSNLPPQSANLIPNNLRLRRYARDL